MSEWFKTKKYIKLYIGIVTFNPNDLQSKPKTKANLAGSIILSRFLTNNYG